MTITIPSGGVTPHGRYHILKGDRPMVSLMSPNDQIVIWLMGGHSQPDPTRPESVQIDKSRPTTGLMAPWNPIDQQGATEDGVTFVDGLYEPMEVQLPVTAFGRDAKHTRWVVRKLHESLDLHKQSELGWMTHELGYWWAPIRWLKPAPDQFSGTPTRQNATLQLRADSAFWQSYPDLASFGFAYEDMIDEFNVDYSGDIGPMWPQHYTGTGTGYLHTTSGLAAWVDDPDSIFFTGTRRVIIGPYKDFATAGDDGGVGLIFNNTPEYSPGEGAANDLWIRMGRDVDGNWDGNGVRGRIGWGYVQITTFKNFVETKVYTQQEFWPPLFGEEWRLQCTGRNFQLVRINFLGANVIMNVTETGSDLSFMGAAYRGVGFGMQGGAAFLTQATPAQVREIGSDGGTLDTFGTNTSTDLGANWPLRYSGLNDAYVHAAGGSAVWEDNSGTGSQEVVNGPYKDFETATDAQVVTMMLGATPEWSMPESGANDVWARMGRNADGSWDGNGIRARVTLGAVSLTAFVAFAAVWDRTVNSFVIPGIGDNWSLVAGYDSSPRLFKILRNGAPMLQYQEPTAISHLGAAYRGVGFGARAAGALITQATPATVRKMSAGDNAETSQSGFLKRHNAGDQKAYDEITLYGPFTKVLIANGPGSTDMVEFGPLAIGEIAHIRTDPRRKMVFDYTERTGNVVAPALFGASPNDTMTRRLKGRFTSDCAIPAKEPGMRVATHQVAVSILGGNADSRIDSQLTPLRRYPQ